MTFCVKCGRFLSGCNLCDCRVILVNQSVPCGDMEFRVDGQECQTELARFVFEKNMQEKCLVEFRNNECIDGKWYCFGEREGNPSLGRLQGFGQNSIDHSCPFEHELSIKAAIALGLPW